MRFGKRTFKTTSCNSIYKSSSIRRPINILSSLGANARKDSKKKTIVTKKFKDVTYLYKGITLPLKRRG